MLVFLLLVATTATSKIHSTQQWRIHSSAFRSGQRSGAFFDEQGRERLFHGTNVVVKGPPWHPIIPGYLPDNASLDALAESGINVVRLGWMWSGFEPADDKFDDAYFQIMEDLVARLADRRIYTLLDMHQDVMSSKFCLYDGIPLWVIAKSQTPAHAFPWPFQGPCASRSWMLNSLSDAAQVAMQSLYDNYNGMRDDLADFWRESARRWRGNKNILGYEIINEPFPGNTFLDDSLLLPGVAGRKNLLPLYDAVATTIRQIDSDTLIFYEPVTWGMLAGRKFDAPVFVF